MASDTDTAKPERGRQARARTPASSSRFRWLPGSRLGRLILALNLLGLAILIGVPVAVAVFAHARWRALALGLASLLQTVPSLALLAVLISALDITTYTIGVPPETTLLFKAVVVVVLCLSQSTAFRAAVFRRRRATPVTPAAEVPA